MHWFLEVSSWSLLSPVSVLCTLPRVQAGLRGAAVWYRRMNMIIKPCCPAPLPLAELWVRRAGPAKLWIWWLAGLGCSAGGAALGEGSGKTVATLETPPPRPGHGQQRLVAGTPAGPGHYIIAMIWDQCALPRQPAVVHTAAAGHTVPYDSCPAADTVQLQLSAKTLHGTGGQAAA